MLIYQLISNTGASCFAGTSVMTEGVTQHVSYIFMAKGQKSVYGEFMPLYAHLGNGTGRRTATMAEPLALTSN